MWKRLISLSLTFGIAATAPPALAQESCNKHAVVADRLETLFGETVIGRGLQSEVSLFEIWRSTETGTWTILRLNPDGVACVMATGFAWTDAKPKPSVTETGLR